uniref:Armadillo repeat containing 12 n=1 Tax=Loxodonta africana TaxID=9785 RepID=G3UMY2_LOXAF
MGMSIPECLGQLDIRKGVVGLATGAGAIYLLYKAIKAGIKCQPPICTNSPICIARLAIERERHGRDSGELRRLFNSLECKQDEYAKSMILHSITRCVYLLEAEASACTVDDIRLVGYMLDDEDNSVKIQALNTLKAFSGIRKFRLKIQFNPFRLKKTKPKLFLDLQVSLWQMVYLSHVKTNTFPHPVLRFVLVLLLSIVESLVILATDLKLRLIGKLRSNFIPIFLPSPLQVQSNFLTLFQSTQPGSLLFEVLLFAERLSEGRNSPHYRAVKWHYNEQSLHEALFGDESRLADRLLALVIHPEEEVQIQACKVIVSLQCPQDLRARPSCQRSSSFFNSGE